MTTPQSNTPPARAGCVKGASQIHPKDTGDGLAIAGRGTSLSDADNPTRLQLSCLPPELTSRARWVLWRDNKIPYCAARPNRRASCTNASTWATFDAVRSAYEPHRDRGIGFVLGDGIAGVDIDHDTGEAARFLLETVGCGYIETSPSGDGLHGWAFSSAKLPRCKGVLDGMHVEVYARDRYFTVTGHALAKGSLVRSDCILRLSEALEREAKVARFSESSESSESSEDHKGVCVRGRFLPKRTGERNAKVFEWCRHVKTIDPEATVQQQMAYARQWFNAAHANIGTKDLAVTIDDFLRGWQVALPEGFDMKQVAAEAAKVPVPPLIADALGEHALTFGLCVVLQHLMSEQPFFLPTRKLAQFLDTSQPTAAAAMRILRSMGVLIMSAEHTRTQSPRYHVAPEYLGGGIAAR